MSASIGLQEELVINALYDAFSPPEQELATEQLRQRAAVAGYRARMVDS